MMENMTTLPTLTKQAFDTAGGVFLLTDSVGTALYANGAVERRTGFSLGEVVGKAPGKLWGGHMPRAFYDAFWETIEERREPFVSPITNARKDKKRYPEFLAVAPIADKQGGIGYFIALQVGHLVREDDRERFTNEFRHVFGGRRATETERRNWLLRAIGTRESTDSAEIRTLADILHEDLVEPTKERFRSREDDRELLLAAQTDPKRFQALYEKYRHQVRRHFLRHLCDEELSEDLAQDTFYRAFRYLSGFQSSNASYGTYLQRVAHSVLLNHFRKKQPLFLENEVYEVESGYDLSPASFLWEAPVLNESERKMLSLKYREGFSLQEIASMLGKSENAVKLSLSRARKKLKKSLEGS